MDNYTFTIRAPVDELDASTYTAFIGHIKPGPYKAVFKMLGLSTAGYLSVRWGGTTNYSNNRSDGRVVACAFGSYDSDLCTGVLYLTPPEPQLTVSFYGEDDVALIGRCETNCDH
jgi:hypothetical protein